MRTKPKRRSRQGGFTLIEVLVALVLFAIISSGFTAFAVQSLRRTTDTRGATGAVLVAQRELENLRGLAYDDIAGGSSTTSMQGQNYSINTVVSDDTPASGMKQVSVTVAWNSPIGPRTYELETILTAITPS